jgi:hypothetical protein
MPDLTHSIDIDSDPKSVFPLLAAASGLAQWWAEDAAEVSGGIELGFFDRSTMYRLRSHTLVRPVSALWHCETGKEWAGTRLIFLLTGRGGKTALHFTHADWRAATEYFVACNTAWGALMFRLKSAAEGHAPGPLFTRQGLARG